MNYNLSKHQVNSSIFYIIIFGIYPQYRYLPITHVYPFPLPLPLPPPDYSHTYTPHTQDFNQEPIELTLYLISWFSCSPSEIPSFTMKRDLGKGCHKPALSQPDLPENGKTKPPAKDNTPAITRCRRAHRIAHRRGLLTFYTVSLASARHLLF